MWIYMQHSHGFIGLGSILEGSQQDCLQNFLRFFVLRESFFSFIISIHAIFAFFLVFGIVYKHQPEVLNFIGMHCQLLCLNQSYYTLGQKENLLRLIPTSHLFTSHMVKLLAPLVGKHTDTVFVHLRLPAPGCESSNPLLIDKQFFLLPLPKPFP